MIRQYLGHYFVSTVDNEVDCALSTKLRKQLQYPEASPGSRRNRVQSVRRPKVVDPVAIGDRVIFDGGNQGKGMILEVLPRRNKISRQASGSSRKEQILAANIDQVVPVFSASEPAPNWHLLDRMLAIAEWQQIPATICFNKIDLTSEDSAKQVMATYRNIGYPVMLTSIITDLGKESFKSTLKNEISLFMGPSGVGKSSLLNWLQPGLQLRTGEISQVSGEGKHTTSHTELVELDGGGFVGDLPGVKEYHLWGIDAEDIPDLFREFQPFLGRCRFRDCSHIHEPECAIREALADEEISQSRYDSYTRLRKKP